MRSIVVYSFYMYYIICHLYNLFTFIYHAFFVVDDLEALSVHITSDSTNLHTNPNSDYALPSFDQEPNCYNRAAPFYPGETRSLICGSAIFGNTILIYKPETSVDLKICEIEIYSYNDKTDIPVPTWESQWNILPNIPDEKLNITEMHNLSQVPIYGKLIIYISDGVNKGYTYDFSFLHEDVDDQLKQYGLSCVPFLSYNNESYFIHSDSGCTGPGKYFACRNSSEWTQAFSSCESEGVVIMYKVQFWTFCGFVRPSYLSPWIDIDEASYVNTSFSHSLGATPVFGFIQYEYKNETLALIKQITGISQLLSQVWDNNNSETKSGLAFSEEDVYVSLSTSSGSRYRIILWSKLGEVRPSYSETFQVYEFIGPEVLNIPPTALSNSFINILVCTIHF